MFLCFPTETFMKYVYVDQTIERQTSPVEYVNCTESL